MKQLLKHSLDFNDGAISMDTKTNNTYQGQQRNPDVFDLVIKPQNYSAQPHNTFRLMSSPRNSSPSKEYHHDGFSSISKGSLDDENQAGSNSPRHFSPEQNEDFWISSTIDQMNHQLWENTNINTIMSSNIDGADEPSMSLNELSTVQPLKDETLISQPAIPVKKETKQGMQQLDNLLFKYFYGWIRGMYENKYTGIKRYNWEPTANSQDNTRRLKTKMFF